MIIHRSTLFMVLGVLLLGGCAASPSKIQPAMVSRIPYGDMSCRNLELQLDVEISNLETLSGEQIDARSWDIALNIILLPGFGALTGDNETEIAQSKGRIIAIQEEYAERCIDESKPKKVMVPKTSAASEEPDSGE